MRALLLIVLATVLSLQAQPRSQRFTLPNGLQVLLLEDHEHPLVRARLHFQIHPGDSSQGRQGLPLLLLRMLNHSETADLKAEDVERILEESGIQLTSALGPDGLSWRVVARSRDQDRAMGLLADRLLRTVFLSSVLEIQRLATWRQVESQELPPLARLQLELLSDPVTRPTALSLGSISLEDLFAFRAKVFRPDRAVLILHGDLGLEQAKRLVLLSLGTWTVRESPASAGPPPQIVQVQPPSTTGGQPRISAPGRELCFQTVAPAPGGLSPETAALLGLLVPGDADLSPVSVTLQDGQLLATLDGIGTTGAGAWSLLQQRLEAYRQHGYNQADLDRVRRAWLARRSLDSLHPEAQMDSALAEVLGGGVTDERMHALKLETLNAGLRAWLDPARFRTGVVGDPERLKELTTP